ncbi:MAG TPA: hypothetical protein VGB42_03605 [Candidatus Thermoplasmatota archaeon]
MERATRSKGQGPEDGERPSRAVAGRPAHVVAGALLVLVAAALGAGAAAAAPTVVIDSPANLDVVASGTVPIQVTVTNFTLDGSAVGGAPVPDEGHYHIMLDGVYQKFDHRLSTFLADVTQGVHVLTIELAENDHTLLGINDSVTITVPAGVPRVRITAPTDGSAVNSSSVELAIQHDNFTFDPMAIGGMNQPGRGHYHVLIDGAYYAFGATPFFNVSELTVGASYRLRVELHENDHSLYQPATFDEVLVTIPAGAPSLALDSAPFSGGLNSSSVAVGWTVANFIINPSAIGGAAVPGEGHYHAWLDGVFLGPSADNPLELTDLAEGPHTLVVELRNNDHSELSPRVVAWAAFTVRSGAPSVSIVSPASSGAWNSSSVELQVAVTGIVLDPMAVGGANAAGRGHYHVLLDGSYFWYGAEEFFNLTRLTPGATYAVRVQLHNNDHTPLLPAVWDEVTLTVSPGAPELLLEGSVFEMDVDSSSLAVGLLATNITFNPGAIGGAPAPGEGHYHAWLDGVLLGPSTDIPIELTRLPEGPHTLVVELRQNNHAPLSPRVVDWTLFTVVAGAPRVTILSPADGTTLDSSSAELRVDVTNFVVDAGAVGGTNVAGTGHYHVLLDGSYFWFGATEFFNLTRLTPGESYLVRVELHNNDHTLRVPAVWDEVQLTVAAGAPELLIDGALFQATLDTASVSVAWTHSGFTIDPTAIGGTNVVGEGHYHAWLDGAFLGPSADNPLVLYGVSPGPHELVMELRNNDHSALSPRVVDWTLFTVAAGAPSIRITAPSDGSTVPLNWTVVTVEVANLILDPDAVGGSPVAGRGHWHVFVDGVYISFSATGQAVVADLTPGVHTLRVQLHQNNHEPLDPAVFHEVTVTVEGKRPSIAITSPAGGAVVWGDRVTVTTAVSNWTLDAVAVGGAPVPGTGHWHVFVDGTYVSFSAALSVELTGLTPGDHEVKVALHNNDHTAIAVPAEASITLHVAAVPAVSITAPADGTQTHETSVTISITVVDFTMDAAAIGGATVAGRGHVHLIVDGVDLGPRATVSFPAENLSVGTHTIRVELRANDHLPIPGAEAAEVVITVTQAAPPPAGGGMELLIAGAALVAVAAVAGALLMRKRGGAAKSPEPAKKEEP